MSLTDLALITAATTDATSKGRGIITFTVVVSLLIVLGLWLGWRSRKKRQAHVPAPQQIPAEVMAAEPVDTMESQYITTVAGHDWLERIAVHGLGLRAEALVEVHPTGVAILMAGAPNFFIPTHDITEVKLTSGMAGKFVEKHGILAISWMLGDQLVTSGFRASDPQSNTRMMGTIKALNPALTATEGSENNA